MNVQHNASARVHVYCFWMLTMKRLLFVLFLKTFCIDIISPNGPEPELSVDDQSNLILNAGTGSIIMKYASGTTATVDQVKTKLDELTQSNNDLREKLSHAQNASQVLDNRIQRFISCQATSQGYNTSTDECVPLVPQCSREGETLEFHGGLNRYICSSFLLDTINNMKTNINMLLRGPTSIIGDISSMPGRTCRDIKEVRPRALSGVYWISQSPNGSYPYRVYCDMLTDGGGWTLVTVVKGTRATYERKYPINGMNEDKLLADRTDEWASLSKAKLNAIFDARNDSIMRIYVSAFTSVHTGDTSRFPRTYYIRKLKYKERFDAFVSIRFVPEWGDKTKDEYKINYDRQGRVHPYDPDAHDFPDSGKAMNHWEDHVVIIRGEKYSTSRHGIVGDIYSNCEWLYKFHVSGTATALNCLSTQDVYGKIWIK